MRWRLHLKELDCNNLYCPRLLHQVRDAVSKLLHPSDTSNCEPAYDEIPTFQSSLAALKQRLKEKRMLGASFVDIAFEAAIVLTQFYIGSHTPVDENLDNGFNAND